MYNQSVGIIGGFGAYATLGFYKNMLKAFATDSERNYPHIYMDNDFTMPSRTRALLFGENYDEVVQMIATSIKKMDQLGADYIVLVCGTAHAFLNDVYKIVPDAREKVLNIIEILRERLKKEDVSRTLIIAAEGTLKQRIYPEYLESIECINPSEDYYQEIRYFIESVKRNSLDDNVYQKFISFVDKFNCKNIILGCTEFPILVEALRNSKVANQLSSYCFWDPLDLTITKLKNIIK